MSLPTHISAYADCEEIFARAAASEKGIRIRCGSVGKGRHLRSRLYEYRRKDRKRSMASYTESDPQYNRSSYEEMLIKCEKGSPVLEILNAVGRVDELDIEPIIEDVE